MRFRYPVTAEISFFLYQEPFFFGFFVSFRVWLVDLDPEIRRNDLLPTINLLQSFAVVGIDQPKLKLRDPRELSASFLNFRGVETRDLHQNSVLTDWAYYRLAAAEVINALPD